MPGIQRRTECEDWVEIREAGAFACVGRGAYETLLNFGGPGAAINYHFYGRFEKGAESAVQGIKVDGLEFVKVWKPLVVPGTPPSASWVHFGTVKTGRSYRQVTLRAPAGLAGLDCLCVAQIPLRMESGEIERQIQRRGLQPEPLSGVPLGGVGAGKLEFCRDGLFRNITINGNIDTPVRRSEGGFFAVRCESAGESRARIVATDRLHGLQPFESLAFEGVYPYAELRATERDFPVEVVVRASGVVIPQNVEDSSLPAALFRVSVTSRADQPVTATVAFSMENFLGCGGSVAPGIAVRKIFDEGYYEVWEERSGNRERPWSSGKAAGIEFTGGAKEEKRSDGTYVLATDGKVSSRLTGWRFAEKSDAWLRFADTGLFPASRGKPSQGEPTAAAVAVKIKLAPGETKEVRFVFAWFVPVFFQVPGIDYGHYYANRFASAAEVAHYCLTRFDRLERDAAEVPRLLLASSLPPWLARSLCNDAYVFSTATWLTKDGRFAVNEGPTHMFGCMGTLDQKLYANHYNSLFFPELDKTELLGFVRSPAANGGVQHDLGYGHIEQKDHPHGWPDLSSALAILSLKHYLLTGDEDYINEAYPGVVKALLEYQLGMDSDGDGIANISGVGNTFDSEKYEGTSSYVATVWLAALRCLEGLAVRRGDSTTVKRCRAAFRKARASAVKELWNGEFFVNYYDSARRRQCPNSHISQVAGEFFAKILGFESLYGDKYVRSAAKAMLRLNYPAQLIMPTNEATLEGRMPTRFMWGWLPHCRLCLGGVPMYFGMAEQGLAALKRMDDAIANVNHDNRWDQRLFYEPDTGRQHWGRFYMSAPATWYLYQALLGYRWNAPDGVLEISPNVPDTLLPFEGPLFTPAFWGWLRVDAGRRGMRLKIIKTFKSGILLKRLRISRSGALVVSVDGARVKTTPLAGGWHACRLDLSKLTVLEMKKGVHDPACTLRRGTGVPPVSKVNGRWQERRDGQDA